MKRMVRPATPPASLMLLKYASIPALNGTPTPAKAPEVAAVFPTTISVSVTPCTTYCRYRFTCEKLIIIPPHKGITHLRWCF
jgi:hypothetical protein